MRAPLAIGGLFFINSAIFFNLVLETASWKKIAYGVKISGEPLKERTCQKAQEELAERWDKLISQKIIFIYRDRQWTASLNEFGFDFDQLSTFAQAYEIGRNDNYLKSFWGKLMALLGNHNIAPKYILDKEKFQNFSSQIFSEVEHPSQNADLEFDEEKEEFIPVPSASGTAIDKDRLLHELKNRMNHFSTQKIVLAISTKHPSIEDDEVSSALQNAQTILSQNPYQLVFETGTWKISRNRLLEWIDFKPVKEKDSDNEILGFNLNTEKVTAYLNEIASGIDQPSTDATLVIEGKKAVAFNPGQPGFEVKREATIEKFLANLLSAPPVKKTFIIADKAYPETELSQTNNLGIDAFLAQGTSNFYGSPKNRIHNIKTGAEKFNGLILEPGEEFSFNSLLGGSDAEQGFLPELVIKNKKTVLEYGGGLCQVSTTAFRAAVKAGLDITERQAHAFPVQYYNPQGFDATIYEPKPDLRFVNDTPGHLLIQTIVNSYQLIFNFYGTDDNRKVNVKGPYILESNEDGSMKTILTEEVWLNSKLINKETFYSNYKSPDLYPIAGSEEE